MSCIYYQIYFHLKVENHRKLELSCSFSEEKYHTVGSIASRTFWVWQLKAFEDMVHFSKDRQKILSSPLAR